MAQYRELKTPLLERLQRQLQDRASQRGMDIIGQNYERPSFEPIRQEETRRFMQEILPQVFGPFGQSTGTSPFSPNVQTAAGGAASQFASGLGALRSQFDVTQQQQEQNYLNSLLQFSQRPQYNYAVKQEEPSLLDKFFGTVGNVAATGLGAWAGGPGGAMAANKLYNYFNPPKEDYSQYSLTPAMNYGGLGTMYKNFYESPQGLGRLY